MREKFIYNSSTPSCTIYPPYTHPIVFEAHLPAFQEATTYTFWDEPLPSPHGSLVDTTLVIRRELLSPIYLGTRDGLLDNRGVDGTDLYLDEDLGFNARSTQPQR